MNEFNLLVLNIACVVLIISLIVVGIILYYSIRDSKFPPFESTCPTYYMLDQSGNNCVFNNIDSGNQNMYAGSTTDSPYYKLNSGQLASNSRCLSVPVSQFYYKNYTDDDILCSKKKWANGCSVYWDGVTNNPNACIKYSDNLFVSNNN